MNLQTCILSIIVSKTVLGNKLLAEKTIHTQEMQFKFLRQVTVQITACDLNEEQAENSDSTF